MTKAFGERQVLRGIDLTVAEHEAVGADRRLRLGQVDAAARRRPARGDRRRRRPPRRRGDHRPRGQRGRGAAASSASSSRPYNLFPHMTALENVVLGETPAPTGCRVAGGRGARAGAARPLRPRRPRGRQARQPLRRRSSSGWRSPAPSPASRALLLDEDQRPRPGAGRRASWPRSATWIGGGDDDGDRDPRDGLRLREGRRPVVAFLHAGRIPSSSLPA